MQKNFSLSRLYTFSNYSQPDFFTYKNKKGLVFATSPLFLI